mmetsp:Transcript_1637/g.1986  ORF Transcript_1637/g.1986 Transcript_1637/m.1986 type:complete len:199 (-) Transcript_1637:565-1161(-)
MCQWPCPHTTSRVLNKQGTSQPISAVAYDRTKLHALFGYEDQGVEIRVQCKNNSREMLQPGGPNKKCRDELKHEQRSAVFSFQELLNTTFGLVPGGRRPNSYRFIETLARGVIPVVIQAIPQIPALSPIVPWHTCLVQVHDEDIDNLVSMLEDLLASGRANDLQRNCIAIYNQYFFSTELQTMGAWNATISFIRGFSR